MAIIGKHGNQFSGNWASMFIYGKPYDGLLITESFDGKIKNEVRFINGKAVKLTKTVNGVTKIINPVTAESLSLTPQP